MTVEEFLRSKTFTAVSFAEEEYVILDLDAESAVDMARSEEREKLVKWISVDERLPDYGITVLVTDGINSGCTNRSHQDYAKDKNEFLYLITCNDVKYWMPIPALPNI